MMNRLDNQNIGLQYYFDNRHIINVNYSFIRRGDIQPGLPYSSSGNNLKQSDISFVWPINSRWSMLGRWTKNINRDRLQNLLYGLEYDSCCWAGRIIGGRTFTHLGVNNIPSYDTAFYIQFALKGLGYLGHGGDPSTYITNHIGGFSPTFGQDY